MHIMRIESDNCILIPLTSNQLELWINDITQLEDDIGYEYDGEIIVGDLLDIISKQIPIVKLSPKDYIYNSFFLIVVKELNSVVGSLCFKGMPNDDGEIEIGYGLAKHHEHCGYMTESVQSICKFAKSQPNIKAVIAETEMYNQASQRVLLRCGFKQYKQTNTIWWRI